MGSIAIGSCLPAGIHTHNSRENCGSTGYVEKQNFSVVELMFIMLAASVISLLAIAFECNVTTVKPYQGDKRLDVC